MKKILFYSSEIDMGGAVKVLIEVLKNLNLEKYEIDVLVKNLEHNEKKLIDEIPKEIKIITLVSKETGKKYFEFKNKKGIIKKILFKYWRSKYKKEEKKKYQQLSDKNYDIVISFKGNPSDILNVKAKKHLHWLHGSVAGMNQNDITKMKKYVKKLEKYDRIITICDDMKNEINNLINGTKIERIYNPFDFEKIKKLSIDIEEKDNKNLKLLNGEYIISVKRLDETSKDFETLLKAYKIFREKIKKDVKLFILGEGSSRKKIENMIQQMNLEDSVLLFGNVFNPYIWIKNSKFLVHSSRVEGLPTVLIEAMSLGRAVVSSDCPTGPREILENGKSGLLYEVGDYEKLAEKMEKLYLNENLRKKYEECGIKSVERFSNKKIMEEIEIVLDELSN